MITSSEVQALVLAAARPWRVAFDRRSGYKEEARHVYVDAKARKVTVPAPAVGMTEEAATSYLSTVYDAIAAARWVPEEATARNKEGELTDPLAYSVAMRRAQGQAMGTWAGDAGLYEKTVFSPFREELNHLAIQPEIMGDESVLKNIAAEVIAAREAASESAAVRQMLADLPPELRALVDKVPVGTLPASATAAAEAIRKALEIEPPPSPSSDGDGDGEEGEDEGSAACSQERPDPIEKLKPSEYRPDAPPAIGADGIGEFLPTPDNEVIVHDCVDERRDRNNSRTRPVAEQHGLGRVGMYQDAMRNAEDSNIAAQMRRLVQVKMRTRYENGKLSGKINRRAVARLCYPTVGDGTWNARVFRTKSVPKVTTKTAVSILVDFSGSMRGHKTDLTMQAVGALSSALRTLHVKHAINTFTEATGYVSSDEVLYIGRCRDYDDALQAPEVVKNMAMMTYRMGQNGDADAVSWAYRDLSRRKEPRKVLLVLSDGYPCSDRSGDGEAALRNVVSRIEAEGNVEIYALGIATDAPTQFYSKTVCVNTAEEVEPALINIAAGLFGVA